MNLEFDGANLKFILFYVVARTKLMSALLLLLYSMKKSRGVRSLSELAMLLNASLFRSFQSHNFKSQAQLSITTELLNSSGTQIKIPIVTHSNET
mmetsp:Transcript_4397/g.6735  ORF Transcript_4397/g.6735 Transcript_4397/m.6735 type:complete len:95 (-) Transcript_4397:203-487(-)